MEMRGKCLLVVTGVVGDETIKLVEKAMFLGDRVEIMYLKG